MIDDAALTHDLAHDLAHDLTHQLTHESYFEKYLQALGKHTWAAAAPFIDDDATFLFSDGTFIGKAAIEGAFTKTFALILNETYRVQAIRWIHVGENCALCTYAFQWSGVVDGKPCEGQGRGTSMLVKGDFGWKVKYEHLGPAAA